MQIYSAILENNYSIQFFSSIQSIDAQIWYSINIKTPFYQSHNFLSIIEQAHHDIEFRYVIVKKDNEIVAAIYMQLLDFSYKNLVNYSDDNSKGLKASFKKYIAKKKTKLLNLGNVFFTGDKGIISKNEDEIIPLIPQVLKIANKTFLNNKPTASLIANVNLQDEKKCAGFGHSSYHAFTTEPDMYMDIDASCNNFDDYLNSLSSKYRVRAKKVFHASSLIIQKELTLDDVNEYKVELEKLYNNVVNHVAFNMASLEMQCFSCMKNLYEEKCTIFGYYLNNELVSFVCLFHVDEATLHVHYIGLNYEVNKAYKLYNRMLLDFVKFGIEKHKKFIHFGRTATEIKTTVGAKPYPLLAYLKMNNSLMNILLPSFLKRIKPAAFIARNPFK